MEIKSTYNTRKQTTYLALSSFPILSNFLLWELAYSELVFSDTLWPDFSRKDLFDAIKEFQDRDRRFGGLGES